MFVLRSRFKFYITGNLGKLTKLESCRAEVRGLQNKLPSLNLFLIIFTLLHLDSHPPCQWVCTVHTQIDRTVYTCCYSATSATWRGVPNILYAPCVKMRWKIIKIKKIHQNKICTLYVCVCVILIVKSKKQRHQKQCSEANKSWGKKEMPRQGKKLHLGQKNGGFSSGCWYFQNLRLSTALEYQSILGLPCACFIITPGSCGSRSKTGRSLITRVSWPSLRATTVSRLQTTTVKEMWQPLWSWFYSGGPTSPWEAGSKVTIWSCNQR